MDNIFHVVDAKWNQATAQPAAKERAASAN